MSHKAWSLSVTQKQELQHTGLNSKLLFACGEVYGTRFLMQHLSARFWQPIQGKKKINQICLTQEHFLDTGSYSSQRVQAVENYGREV